VSNIENNINSAEKSSATPHPQESHQKPYAVLVDAIILNLETFFASHLDDMFQQADNYLFTAADEATSTDEQNNLFECMSAVRSQKQHIKQFFVDELSFYLQPMSALDALPERKTAEKPKTLSLVEENEMDEMVMLTGMSGRAEMEHAEAINHLILRIKELGESNNDIFHGEALEPRRFCDAILAAVAGTDLIDEHKMLVYRFFNEVIISDLGQFYDMLNSLFSEQGIMPEVVYSGYAVQSDSSSYQNDSAAPEESMSSNATSANSRRAFGSGMQGYAQEQVSYSNTGPSGQSFSAGVPVAQVRQRLDSYVGGRQDVVATAGSASFYSQQQVMTALTDLQVQINDLSKTPLVFDAKQIKKAILSTIGENNGGKITKAVHHFSEKTIDFIKLIFDAIIEEESITAEIKTLLLSLQIPVIKAAMQDEEFFVDDQHPARLLLDKIAEAGVGVSDLNDPVYIDIEKIVRRLLNDYDDDVEAFNIALDDLSLFTEEIYSKARETEAESQKNAERVLAKSVVLKEIRKITIGKELPEGIRVLVLKVWPSMLFNHFLRLGKANDEWVELLMILQKIIESVQKNFLTEDLGLSYKDIIETTRNRLARFKKNKDIIDQVITDLEETYDAIQVEVAQLKQMKPQEQDSEFPYPEDMTPSESPDEDMMGYEGLALNQAEAEALLLEEQESEEELERVAEEKLSRLPEGISAGSWFIVYNGEDKPVRRLKLAAILIHDASMVFVDYLGNVVIEKDAGIFAEEIEKGLSSLIMQHSVFDHALSTALETISPEDAE